MMLGGLIKAMLRLCRMEFNCPLGPRVEGWMLSASSWPCNGGTFRAHSRNEMVVLAAQIHHASGTASDIMLK
jgi:hypothetical protein